MNRQPHRFELLAVSKLPAEAKLDDYTTSVLRKYKDAINLHLKSCGTSFRISTV